MHIYLLIYILHFCWTLTFKKHSLETITFLDQGTSEENVLVMAQMFARIFLCWLWLGLNTIMVQIGGKRNVKHFFTYRSQIAHWESSLCASEDAPIAQRCCWFIAGREILGYHWCCLWKYYFSSCELLHQDVNTCQCCLQSSHCDWRSWLSIAPPPFLTCQAVVCKQSQSEWRKGSAGQVCSPLGISLHSQ